MRSRASSVMPATRDRSTSVTRAKWRGRSGSSPLFAEVNVLVNAAGGARGLEPAQDAKLSDWDEMIATNVTGLVHVTRAALNGMVERGRGHIVNLGSVAGSFSYPGGNVYGATKAFVERFSANLRADLLGTPVRVTNIEPGMVETEFSVVRLGGIAQRPTRCMPG